MNIRLGLHLLAVAALSLSACASSEKPEKATTKTSPVVGGYSSTGNAREFARAAAFAAREESRRTGTPIRIVQVVRGETQVVAGTNIRLRLTANRNGATTETADVVVFRDIFGHRRLTSWRWQ